MEIVKNIDEVVYPSPYWWNSSVNKEANIPNGLPNCTAFVVGAILKASMPPIVSTITDARSWHKHLTNGWYCVPYEEYKNNIKVGDVLEWENGNHVAICSDTSNGVWVSGSFYTGVHGVAYYEGNYDDRNGIVNLQQLNDYFYNNFKYRYFHFVTLEEESRWCGGSPDYVLVSPMSIVPVDKDNSKTQAYVGVSGLRVRTEPSLDGGVRGVAPVGYYNVEKVEGGQFEDGNIWFKTNDLYFAMVNGVQYLPKEEIIPVEEILKLMKQVEEAYRKKSNECDELHKKLKEIGVIANDKQ